MSLDKYEGEVNTVAEQFARKIAPFVRSVRAVPLSKDDILFHIEAHRPIDERKLRLALDIQCGLEPALFKNVLSEWRVLFVSGTCADIRFYTAGWSFDIAFVEALVIGLEPFVPEDRVFGVRDLGIFCNDKEQLLEEYAQWMNSTMTHNTDCFDEECLLEFRPFWLCCPRHRLLRIARKDYLERIGRFEHSDNKKDDAPDHYQPVDYEHPDNDAMCALVEHHLRQEYVETQTLIEDYFTHSNRSESWYQGLPECSFWFHGSNHCCSFHLLGSCVYDAINAWIEYWMWKSNVAFLRTDDGFPYGIGNSINSVSALCFYTGVDVKKITWQTTSWFHEVPIYVEVHRSEDLLQKVIDNVTHVHAAIDLTDAERAFVSLYANRYNKKESEYLEFLDELLFASQPYLQKIYVRLESEIMLADFKVALSHVTQSPMLDTALANLEKLIERDAQVRIMSKRFLVSFVIMGLLVEEDLV